MAASVHFLNDPEFKNSIILFILSPPGITYDYADIGRSLFGKTEWRAEAILVPGLADRNGFRFSDIPVHWEDFLALSFRSADHALLYIPGKKSFHEVTKAHLLQQNPDMFSFSFYRFQINTPTTKANSDMATDKLAKATGVLNDLLAAGWSGAAVSKVSGINQVTIGSIKNGKSSRISDKVYSKIMALKDSPAPAGTRARKAPTSAAEKTVAAPAKKKSAAKKQPASPVSGSMINPNYVPVDIVQLRGVVDSLIGQFESALEELQNIKKQIG